MNAFCTYAITGLLLVAFIAAAGCSKYADPELKITSNLTKISEDQTTGNITYNVAVTVTNTGQNNAYHVRVLTILSTPKDLPEYRFINHNFDIGEVEKGKSESATVQLILPATRSTYDLIISGSRDPEIETKLASVTSNVMG